MKKNTTSVEGAQLPRLRRSEPGESSLADIEELQRIIAERDAAAAVDRANPRYWHGDPSDLDNARVQALSDEDDGDDCEEYLSPEQIFQARRRRTFKVGLLVPMNDADPMTQKDTYEAYRCDVNGVWRLRPEMDTETKLPTGRTQTTRVVDAAILPVEVIRSKDPSNNVTSYVKLACKTGTGTDYFEVTVLERALFSPIKYWQELGDLLEAGVEEKELKKTFGSDMKALIREGVARGLIPEIRGKSTVGWSTPREHLRAGLPGYAGTMPVVVSTKGDAKLWRDNLVDMITESPITGLTVAVGFSSFLRGKVTLETSNMFHLHGEAGRGKTLAANAAASIQGYPNQHGIGNFLDSSTTVVAFERFLAANKDGFAIADEMQSFIHQHGFGSDAKVVALLVRLLNGGGRGTAEKKGGGVNHGSTWNCSIITTGNTDLGQYAQRSGQQGVALEDRLIEIDTRKHPVWPWRDSPRVARYLDVMTKNHGHGYAPAINFIIENELALIASFDRYHNIYSGLMDKYARKAKAFALYRVGIDIMQHVLELSDEVKTQVIAKLETFIAEVAHLSTQEEKDADTNIATDLVGFTNTNLSNFVVKGCLWAYANGNVVPSKTSQQSEAVTHNEKVKAVWGLINQTEDMKGPGEFSGTIAFTPAGVAEAMRRNINIADLAAKADLLKFLEHTPSEPHRPNKKHATYGRVYEFNIGKALSIQSAVHDKSSVPALVTVAKTSDDMEKIIHAAPKFVIDPDFVARTQALDNSLDEIFQDEVESDTQ